MYGLEVHRKDMLPGGRCLTDSGGMRRRGRRPGMSLKSPKHVVGVHGGNRPNIGPRIGFR